MTGVVSRAGVELGDYLAPASLETTLRIMFLPRSHLVRVIERFEDEDARVARKTSLEFQVPAAPLLVPIAFPRRRGLIDTLRIEATPTVHQSTLGRTDTIHVSQHLLKCAADVTQLPGLDQTQISQICEDIPSSEVESSRRLAKAVRKILVDAPGGSLTPDQAMFLRAIDFFTYRRPLFVMCLPDSPLLKVSFETSMSQHEIRVHALRENFRTATGRRPDSFLIDVPLANRAQSYHLRLEAPPFYYVRGVECFRRKGDDLALRAVVKSWEVAEFKPATNSCSGLRADATGLCHVHMVNVGKQPSARRGLLLRVSVAEQPLGELGSACIRLFTVLAGGVILSLVGDSIVTAPSSTLISLFVGLPALLGVSFFSSLQSGFRGPLLARVANRISAASAIALAFILVGWTVSATRSIQRSETYDYESFTMPVSIAGAIAFVGIIVIVTLLWCCVSLYRNLRRFIRARQEFVNRRRDQDTQL